MPVIPATKEDIPALVDLVNSAYRGDYSKRGWTTEADLLKGALRIDIPVMKQQIDDPDSVILKYTDAGGLIKGCVYLRKREAKIYLGMLTVEPSAQAYGIGKQLLAASEVYAAEHGFSVIQMTVISERHELIAWYNRHGYFFTGKTKPFTVDERFGVPVHDLSFIVLEKNVQTETQV